MDTAFAVEKTVSFRTRDFWAESQEKDGTVFQVTRRSDGEHKIDEWWDAHRFDNHRGVFKDTDDEDGIHLLCEDEVEAKALVMALQREWNEVAL